MTSPVESFRKWLRFARRKDRYCYHEGFLMFDRGSDNKDCRTPEQSELSYLADIVSDAHRRGAVTLLQRKRMEGRYSYYAQKR